MEKANYHGRNKILASLAETSVSQEALDIVQVIGPKRFCTLEKKGELRPRIKNQYLEWIINAPESVMDDLKTEWEDQTDEEFDMEYIAERIDYEFIRKLVDQEPDWLKEAPRMLRSVMAIIFRDDRKVLKHSRDDFFILRPGTMLEAFDDYFEEAIEYLGYIGAL